MRRATVSTAALAAAIACAVGPAAADEAHRARVDLGASGELICFTLGYSTSDSTQVITSAGQVNLTCQFNTDLRPARTQIFTGEDGCTAYDLRTGDTLVLDVRITVAPSGRVTLVCHS